MTVYRYCINFILILICCNTLLACSESTDTRVIDPRSGQLTQALSISFQQSTAPLAESETTPVGPATIANLTSAVELYEVEIESNKPVSKILMDLYYGGTTTRVGESIPTSPTTKHVIKTTNSGYLHSFINDGEEVKAYFYVDTRGLAGESLTLRITSVKVKINGGNELQLSSQNRSTNFFVQEPAKIELAQGTTNTAFNTAAGTNDLWQNFTTSNASQNHHLYIEYYYVYSNVQNLTLTLNDHQGNLIGTFTNSGNGVYSLRTENLVNKTSQQIAPGTTHAYQLRGNANGNKAIQLTSMQVDGKSGTGLYGTDHISLNRVITYP